MSVSIEERDNVKSKHLLNIKPQIFNSANIWTLQYFKITINSAIYYSTEV